MNEVNDEIIDMIILLVEDNLESCEELKSLLELDFKHVYTANDGCQGLEEFKKAIPDIIITDIDMPCLNGLEMMKEVRKINNEIPVIYLSAHLEVEMLQEAIELKVLAYISKPFSYNELFKKITDNILSNIDSSTFTKILSKREYEIFIDIAKGIKPSEIALKYDIKSKTVSTYRNRILEKLNINTNTDIIKIAISCDLV